MTERPDHREDLRAAYDADVERRDAMTPAPWRTEVVDGPGLRDFVERQMADLAGGHDEEGDLEAVFLEDPFAAASAGSTARTVSPSPITTTTPGPGASRPTWTCWTRSPSS